MSDDLPVLDLTMLEEVYEDDVAGMVELLDIAQRTVQARSAPARRDRRRRPRSGAAAAHGIKGALGNVGGHAASAVASAIEQHARRGEWEPVPGLANELDSALARFDTAIASYRASVS